MTTNAPTPGPGRTDKADAVATLRRAQADGGIPPSLESLAAPLAIVDARRAVIFANKAFLDLAGADGLKDACGSRPGEILRCINAGNGCGDGEACGFCGARGAIAETQGTGKPAARECHITVGATGRPQAHDLLVRTAPFEIDGCPYVMVSLSDISDQKRRAALERIFFHDMLNTASSFRVSLDLLGRADLSEERRQALLERLSAVCDTLEEEIQGQKLMLSAENGTLRPQRNLIESRELALQVTRQAEGLPAAHGRCLAIAPFSERITFISDDALVKRILGNMVKNALEASPDDAVVTVGFRRHADSQVAFSVHNTSFMDTPVQLQVFKRYFSTKGDGRGLGTWGMKLLAEEYLGGSVSFTSCAETGTTFWLTLPLKPREA
jgi:hypothetical protein